jgi:hypothetical protein
MRLVELLIEREREAEALGGVIEAALAGHGGALLIEGEAGIGKTRLLATARGRAAVVGRARAVTRGNPLYLSELLLHARERGADPASDPFLDGRAPPQLVRLVADRLERLSPGAAALARAVAVLGGDADPGRARTLAGLTAGDAILAEEILHGERVLDPEEFAFAHPLVATAARDSIGAQEAAALHAGQKC